MAIAPDLRRWLLTGADPSVRWRVLRELLDRPESDPAVRAARREVGRVGWAASILAEQLPDGQWLSPGTTARDLYRPKYLAANWRLLVLADLGVSGNDRRVRRALDLYLRRFGPSEFGGPRSEHCVAGNAVRMLLQFGRFDDPHVRRGLAWLVRTQKPDGGWHCFPARHGTLDAWEGLSAFAAVPPAQRSPALARSIERGAEFFLSRGLLREGARYAPWYRLHYPVHYYYDLLVGLDVLTRLGYAGDRRLRGPLDRLERMRDGRGRWRMDALQPDPEPRDAGLIRTPVYPFALELPGMPSRWITTTALGVLRRAGRV
jgi:hypothetical protein